MSFARPVPTPATPMALGLFLSHLIRDDAVENNEGRKKAFLHDLQSAWNRRQNERAWMPLLQRQKTAVVARLQALVRRGWRGAILTAKTRSRLAVGLGTGLALENSGLATHPVLGYPCIPGSAIKGLTRAASPIARCDLFGDPSHQGKSLFFDAIPGGFPKVAVDLVNPHFKAWYQSHRNPPADYLSPEMAYFLTVQEGSTFLFPIAVRKGAPEGALVLIREWLTVALDELGVGGKTAAGYGRMTIEGMEEVGA